MSVFFPHTPGIDRLLELQQEDDAAVTHDRLERIAHHVIQLAARLIDPVVYPVGDSAQRVVGAVSLISKGSVEVSTWTSKVHERDVLLVGTVAATTVEFETVAGVLRRRGASHVHACALRVDSIGSSRNIDTFELFDAQPSPHLQAM